MEELLDVWLWVIFGFDNGFMVFNMKLLVMIWIVMVILFIFVYFVIRKVSFIFYLVQVIVELLVNMFYNFVVDIFDEERVLKYFLMICMFFVFFLFFIFMFLRFVQENLWIFGEFLLMFVVNSIVLRLLSVVQYVLIYFFI